VSKTITLPTQAEIRKYHKELKQKERQERKDRFILLSLAVAGLIGVYALVLNGVEQNNLTDTATPTTEQEINASSKRAAVSSLN